MRARIKFSKYDTMRFIGHLDVQRYFQRLFNRTNLPMKYSEGFHPHQILSFAQPLSLGVTSDGEYLDIELTEDVDPDEITRVLNEHVSQGVYINKTVRISDREDNKKLITDEAPVFDYVNELTKLLNKESLIVTKKTKKGEREVDLKEFIYEVYDYSDGLKTIYQADDCKLVVEESDIEKDISHAPEFENGKRFIISLAAGSEININPELVINALADNSGVNISINDFRLHRMDLLGGNKKESVSLCQIP